MSPILQCCHVRLNSNVEVDANMGQMFSANKAARSASNILMLVLGMIVEVVGEHTVIYNTRDDYATGL